MAEDMHVIVCELQWDQRGLVLSGEVLLAVSADQVEMVYAGVANDAKGLYVCMYAARYGRQE